MASAQTFAKAYHSRDHSNDPTGADQEDIPAWARAFYRLFEDTVSASSEAVRTERRQTVSSLIGCQVPLGYCGNSPAELRTKTTWNEGTAALRARVIGNVSVEERAASNGNEEGVDDIVNC